MFAAAIPSGAQAAQPARRYVYVFTTGTERCPPPSSSDEIVVCANTDEGERYRIPPRLRAEHEDKHPARSWASQARSLEDTTRFTRPDSCSPVGVAGQTGCTQMLINQWFEERRAIVGERQTPP